MTTALLGGGTPEGRIAAVVRHLLILLLKVDANLEPGVKLFPERPHFEDLVKALRPYLQRELAMARLDEAGRPKTIARRLELANEIAECERLIARSTAR